MGTYDLTSWSQESLTIPERFFEAGLGSLECAVHLFQSMVKGQMPGTWANCCAAASLGEHGVELCLKGALWQAGGPRIATGNGHELDSIFGAFSNLFPGRKFEFQSRLRETVAKSPRMPFNEYFRYPASSSGVLLQNNNIFFDPNIWASVLDDIAAELRRIQPDVMRRYPLVEIPNVQWKGRGTETNTYRYKGVDYEVPIDEVVPEPRTEMIRVGEKGKLSIPAWLAKQIGIPIPPSIKSS